ncbi:hypothetical protein CVT25_000514 [Psilocybe cyanescens]|uniref:Uncharacterized protein n=1 Tax=Psilocybe cyanescens TaxID=93625 RepID=A0A409XRU1_PSICY|nr:hypothetical protein CVT25_000514 [Psilocybe cyanescens]
MSDYIIPGTPGAFDFKAFSKSTQRAFALLTPLLELRRKQSEFDIALDISQRAIEFMAAVKLGVGAARLGYTATVDIIELANGVESMSPDDRAAYLHGTFEIAKKAHDEAKQAHEALRDVRVNLFQLIRSSMETIAAAESSRNGACHSPTTQARIPAAHSLAELDHGLDILEKFGKEISALAQWWDWIKVETQVDPGGRTALVSEQSALTQNIGQWELLRKQFADYNSMVAQLEDSYPKLLSIDDVKKSLPRINDYLLHTGNGVLHNPAIDRYSGAVQISRYMYLHEISPMLLSLSDSAQHVFSALSDWTDESIYTGHCIRDFINAYDEGHEVTKRILSLVMEEIDITGKIKLSIPCTDEALKGFIDEGGNRAIHAVSTLKSVKRNFETCVPILELFEACMAMYYEWWSEISVEENRPGKIPDPERLKAIPTIKEVWTSLRKDYTQYAYRVIFL